VKRQSTKAREVEILEGLATLSRTVIEQGRNQHRASLSNLKRLLDSIEDGLKEPRFRRLKAAREAPFEKIIWPTKSDIDELDGRVFELARSKLGRKRSLSHDQAFALVDKHWSGLHLLERVNKMLRRAADNFSSPPAATKGVEHLRRINSLAQSSHPRSALAKDFVAIRQKLVAGKLKLSHVDWAQYFDLLKGTNETVIHLESGLLITNSSRAMCCVKYLELERENSLWIERVGDWERNRPERHIVDWIERNDKRDRSIESYREEKKKTDQKNRAQRYRRAKIARQKCVTKSKRVPRSSIRRPATLRDARVYT
jgi:hypothetical protein